MKLEIGKLYVCEEYFLMLYPDPDTAAERRSIASLHAGGAAASPGTDAATAAASAAYWSNRFGKPVLYAEKNIPILVIQNKEEYIEVLSGDKSGWIVYQDWLKLKEIV